jgi:hypothetical protein
MRRLRWDQESRATPFAVVAIVNIISITFASFGIGTMGCLMAASSASYDDDEAQEAMTAFNEANLSMGFAIALAASRIVANSLGIYGAVTYNIWMIGASLSVYCVDFVIGVFAVNVISLVMVALFAYPHFFFIKEVSSGIMSEETYVSDLLALQDPTTFRIRLTPLSCSSSGISASAFTEKSIRWLTPTSSPVLKVTQLGG